MILNCMDFKDIAETISVVSNIFVSIITIYLFYKRFLAKGLYFSDIKVMNQTFSPNAIYVSIENRSLKPLIVKELYLIIENKYRLSFPIEKPRIIDAYKLETFEIQYSNLKPKVSMSMLGENSAVIVKTQNGYMYDTFCKKICFRKFKLFFKTTSSDDLFKYKLIGVYSRLFNDEIINPFITHFIDFRRKDGSVFKKVYMDKMGILSDVVPYFGNGIPREIASDDKRLKEYLTDFATEHDLIVSHTKIPLQ